MISKYDVPPGNGSLQGIYGIHQTSNGRTSWKSATKAIWFVQDWNDWLIGNMNDIGTKTNQIRSRGNQDVRSPADMPNGDWTYGERIGVDGDIIIQCKNDKGKILSHISQQSIFFIFNDTTKV